MCVLQIAGSLVLQIFTFVAWFDSWASMVAASDAWVHQMIRELVGYPFGDVTNIQGDDLLVINQMESVSCYGICVKYSNDDLLLSN